MKTSKIDLINKLLAKAESTTFPAEAETFQKRAEVLMVRYGIEQAHLDASKAENDRENIVALHVDFTGSYGIGLQQGIAAALSAYRTCKILVSSGGKYRRVYVIGTMSDAERLIKLAHSLEIQSKIAMKVWWKTYNMKFLYDKSGQWKIRREFINSFGIGAAKRVRELFAMGVNEGSSTDLVLADRYERASDAAWNIMGGWKNEMSKHHRGNLDAYKSGHDAGYNANIMNTEISK